jgi:type IV secretory pathway VirB10-like protein
MEENEISESTQPEEKPKKKKKGNKAVPILIGLMSLGIIGYVIYDQLPKKSQEPAKPAVKQVRQATRQQVEAVQQEVEKLQKVDKVSEQPFTQFGETKTRDIWDELKREAEREIRDQGQGGGQVVVPQPSLVENVQDLKINELDANEDRKVYSATKKEALETEKEEYNLERTSMFAYSRSYEKAIYMERGASPENVELGSTGAASSSEDEAQDLLDPVRKVRYNANPTFKIGSGDILDAVVTHKIISDSEESPVVCNVSKDLLDDKGEWVLIPSGSRVLGRAAQVRSQGASRMFIYFQKIVLPSGVSINLPPQETVGLDTEGSQGVASSVDRHFLMKFGTAFLVGLLDGLGGFAQSQFGQSPGASFFVDRSSSNFKQVNSEILQQYSNIPPTITVRPGHRMKIYFPRNIEISGYQKAHKRAYGRNE